ncbi:hypothetical protein EAM01S_02_02020 [Erwinia amylovora NBRC 12687 = CFBP 1232]|nr:hypothetical protein EAM01S_02_02020 [Erwinia amylovora NBRC 12687 = CFBP 1232]
MLGLRVVYLSSGPKYGKNQRHVSFSPMYRRTKDEVDYHNGPMRVSVTIKQKTKGYRSIGQNNQIGQPRCPAVVFTAGFTEKH